MVPGMFTGLRRHAHIVILKCFYHPKRKLASAGSHPASTPPPHAWVLAVCSSTSCFYRFASSRLAQTIPCSARCRVKPAHGLAVHQARAADRCPFPLAALYYSMCECPVLMIEFS